MGKRILTADEVSAVLSYDPETGLLSAKIDCSTRKAGPIHAKPKHNGYLRINVLGTKQYYHRLAWVVYHGDWPKGMIDHINGNTGDNRIINLRDVSASGNQQNLKKARSHSGSGFLGVFTDRNGRPYSRIIVNGAAKHIGTYSTPEEAHEAYLEAKRKYHAACTI